MTKWMKRLLPLLTVCLVIAAVVVIGLGYFDFISQRIYEDSAHHLEEIYGQVNRSFGAFVVRNWGIVRSWADRLSSSDAPDGEELKELIGNEQKYWGFSDFFFLNTEGECVTPEGSRWTTDLDGSLDVFFRDGKPVMAGEILDTREEITIFAVPVEHGAFNGFGYDAIGISFTNADLANSLNVDAFSGKAKCFVTHDDGTVLLSTQSGGNVFSNYLTYLTAVSDISPESMEDMLNDWRQGKSGILQCDIAGVANCVLYQPVGIQDFILLSVVPRSVMSAGFLSVQKTTTNVLVVIFMILGVTVVTLMIIRGRRQYKRNRTELKYRERMFDVLSNSVDDIFIMLDGEKHSVDYLSPNVERLLGVPVEAARADIRALEKCAVNFDVVIPSGELERIPLNGNIYRECEYMHQSTGERRWYRMTVYHMSIDNMRKYIIVLSDRTQEQQMNQKLQDALTAAKSANEAKSNFLSNMSHDIRTPMNAIVGFSMLMEKDVHNPDKVMEYTRKIMASSQHLLSLINDVLDMSKIESGKTSLNVAEFSLPALLEELSIILVPQAKAKTQELKVIVQGAPPEELIGDKLRLNQILINLLSNAIKYTPVGGKIDFIVKQLPQTAPQFAKLRFVVRDNGIGMSEEFQKDVFSPFSREINSVTNKIQGTGLGMAITKSLVDLMGGIITVESKTGEGSTFTVELSFALPEQMAGEEWYRSKVTRMLVADDEEEICIDIRELMRDAGVDISYATDGSAAVEAAVSAHERGEDFNVILLDWKMPGMNGVETARAIRERIGEDVPILVLTSYDWSDIEDEARSAGINAFMPKPFFASTFWQTIRPLFSEHAVQDKSKESADAGILNGRRFLVAEDNELNAEILTEVLGIEGAECDLAVNGQQALDMFLKSDTGRYDMILMDVQMPIMNGYEATRRIRASQHPEASTIPIVAMTANTFAEDVRDALDSGMNGHLAKPINMEAVRELTGRLLGEKKAQA